MMTTALHTNISSTSIDDITALIIMVVDTGDVVGAGSLVMLSTGVVVSEMD